MSQSIPAMISSNTINTFRFLFRLHSSITFTDVRKNEFKKHRENAITNVHIKPHSFINPALIIAILKGFVSRAQERINIKHLKLKTQRATPSD